MSTAWVPPASAAEQSALLEHVLGQELGARLKQARVDAGLSQEELGAQLGYGPGMISAFENGRRRMKLEDLARACLALGKEPEWFLRTEAVHRAASGRRPVAMTLRAELARLPDKGLSASVSTFLDELDVSDLNSSLPDHSELRPEAAAWSLLEEAGIERGAAVDTSDVCEHFGVLRVMWTFDDALSALLLDMDDQNYVIGANKRHSAKRRRFSVAHELGHATLRHEGTHFLEVTADDMWETPSYQGGFEREANQFAAALLMPAKWVRDDYLAGLRSVPELARQYDVSEAAMGYRLMNLNLE